MCIRDRLLTYPEAFGDRLAVLSETLDPRSPASELVNRTRDYPLQNFLAAFDYPRWPYGYGIGTISLGGRRRFPLGRPVASGRSIARPSRLAASRTLTSIEKLAADVTEQVLRARVR